MCPTYYDALEPVRFCRQNQAKGGEPEGVQKTFQGAPRIPSNDSTVMSKITAIVLNSYHVIGFQLAQWTTRGISIRLLGNGSYDEVFDSV